MLIDPIVYGLAKILSELIYRFLRSVLDGDRSLDPVAWVQKRLGKVAFGLIALSAAAGALLEVDPSGSFSRKSVLEFIASWASVATILSLVFAGLVVAAQSAETQQLLNRLGDVADDALAGDALAGDALGADVAGDALGADALGADALGADVAGDALGADEGFDKSHAAETADPIGEKATGAGSVELILPSGRVVERVDRRDVPVVVLCDLANKVGSDIKLGQVGAILRSSGPGNHPWLIEVGETLWKVSYGGRSKGGATVTKFPLTV